MNESLFGTDGIRRRVGQQPLSKEGLPHLGYAIGQWVVHTYGTGARFLVGCDTRASSDFVKSGFYTGLLCHPLTIVDAGVISTPALSALLRYQTSFDCGAVISASHNLSHDNGIKLFMKHGTKLSAHDEQIITSLYNTPAYTIDYQALGSLDYYHTALQDYISIIMQMFKPGSLHTKKIVIDCAHGATSSYAHDIMQHSGAQIISINNSPTGTNINENCGAVHPENVARAVLAHNAEAGFSFDGDGDRIIAVNKHGEVKDGDDILALLSEHPTYRTQQTFVGTVMSNQGLSLYFEQKNKKSLRASVGDKYVLQKLQEEQLLLGGEPSGHIIMRDYLDCGDGIVTALKIVEALELTDNWEMKTFDRIPSLLVNVKVERKRALTDPDLQALITQAQQRIPYGRLLVRYSGTEHVLRILVEDADQTLADSVAQALAQQFTLHLSHAYV